MQNKSKNIIGPRLASLRASGKMTQAEVATVSRRHGAKLDRAAVAKIETGIRGVLDYELVALAKSLRVPVQSLLRQRRKSK
jgi:transcriptional regulator with XRE-family HTH domain